MLGQHRGDPGPEMRRVVEILDVGAVHTEDVVDSDCRESVDDVVDHPVLPRHVMLHDMRASFSSPPAGDLQRTLQQNLAAVSGNHLHGGDLIDRRRDAARGRRGVAGFGHPGRQPGLAAVATHHDHRQRVMVRVQRSQADAAQVDRRPPVLAGDRTVEASRLVPTCAIGWRSRGHLLRRRQRNNPGPRRTRRPPAPPRPRPRPPRSSCGCGGGASAPSPAATAITRATSPVSPDVPAVVPDSLIAATSSRSSCESRAGTPLSSATASRHAGQLAMCTSNSRRSAADNDPSTYAASHIA